MTEIKKERTTERTQEMKKNRTRKMTGRKEERKTGAPEWSGRRSEHRRRQR